ncbi:MAG: HEAT repeat domain-containing protein [Myxococcales bacterium]|nr:HEAT repeat domain-containing protein [Myxococcales bacterium]
MSRAQLARLFALFLLAVALPVGIRPLQADPSTGTVYYSYEPFVLGGQGQHAFVPKPLARAGSPRSLAQTVIALLRAAKSTEYEGLEISVTDGGVKLTKKGGAVSPIALGELFLSMRTLGLSVELAGRRLSPIDLSAPVFRASVPLALALGARLGHGASVWLPDGKVLSHGELKKRLDGRDRALIAALYRVLKSGAPVQQLAVCRFLRSKKWPGQSAALVTALDSADSKVRIAALKALHGEKSKKIVARLELVAAKDPSPTAKAEAVKLLVAAGVTKYAFILEFEKLKSPSESVVLGAIRRLRATGNQAIVPALLELLGDTRVSVRDAARDAILALKAYASLAKALREAKVPLEVRLALAQRLKSLGDATTRATALGFTIRRASASVALADCATVRKQKLIAATPALILALVRSEVELKKCVIETLGVLGDPRALAALEGVAKTQAELRKLATAAAVSILSRRPIAKVIERATSGSPLMKRWAIQALGEASHRSGGVKPEVATLLLRASTDADVEVRRAAVYSLARTRREDLLHKLLARATDKDTFVRAQLAVALGFSKSAESKAALVKLLDDEEDSVKLEALRSVKKRGLYEAFAALQRLAKDSNVEIRRAAFASLVVLMKERDHETILPVFTSALYDSDEKVKLEVIAGLARIRGKVLRRVVAALDGALSDSSGVVKRAALVALGKTRDADAWKSVVKGLQDGDRAVRKAALDALAVLKSAAARDRLKRFIASESTAELKALARRVLAQLR